MLPYLTCCTACDTHIGGKSFLDQRRTDGEVPDNVLFWEFFGSTLKFSPELKHLLNGAFVHDRKRVLWVHVDVT